MRFTRISGQDLPKEVLKNVAGVAVLALLKKLGSNQGFDIEIHKKIKPGSGIGSSAASSAGAVFAVNRLLGEPFKAEDLIPFAMEGERLASGSAHADNVAPALLGGFSLIRSYEPLEVLPLPTPSHLRMVVLHPHIEVNTRDSRGMVKQRLSLQNAVQQWGNLAAFISSLYTGDYELLGRSMQVKIVVPVRYILFPYFEDLRRVSMENGALGFGISGSGPSVFAMCKGDGPAGKVELALREFYQDKEIEFDLRTSGISLEGVKVIL